MPKTIYGVKTMKKMVKRGIVVTLQLIGGIAGVAVLLFALLLVFITVTEYRPQPIEPAYIQGEASAGALELNRPIDIISWNIGYCGLGAEQDFFMDGGSMMRPPNKKAVEDNLAGIIQTLQANPADMYFLQEIETASARSYYINQSERITHDLGLKCAYTYNHKASFVPYPLPPIGKVASGIGLFTHIPFTESARIALPVPFTWPVRTVNLKRCMLVTRFPLPSGKTLVTVNLHLEAYDDGEGKIAQTKALLDFISAEYEAGNYVVAGGDFNQTFLGMKEHYPVQEGRWAPGALDLSPLSERWQLAIDGRVPSCRLNNAPYTPALTDEGIRKGWQYYAIDGFIVSPNVSIMSVETLDESFRYADHNPVRLRVMLNPS